MKSQQNKGSHTERHQGGQSQKADLERREKHGEAAASVNEVVPMTQSGLRRTLQDAGFHDIRIIDAAYLVQAKTEHGHDVVMFINPPLTRASDRGEQSLQE